VNEVKVYAPFTSEQVRALLEWQYRQDVHPFTCPNRDNGKHRLRRERDADLGALCPDETKGFLCLDCNYTQDWAYEYMTFSDDELAARDD
jgi:hypothetical protein